MLACAMSGKDKKDGPGEVEARALRSGCSMCGECSSGGGGVCSSWSVVDGVKEDRNWQASGAAKHLWNDVRWGMTCVNSVNT
jgi:hypothetical protein